MQEIRLIDKSRVNQFKKAYVGCLIRTKANQILVQQRPLHFLTYPGYLCEFGGRLEYHEKPKDALIRELKEELEAKPLSEDIQSLGAITELSSQHQELIHTFFWYDRLDSIQRCHEGEAKYFNHVSEILTFPKITQALKWLLAQCHKRQWV